ncbi:MAG: tetratricopeptide repeat protein [Deltaproteobacteria bacterium]|nr:tetratricopeptide repeat protein [Deltaproteobacteria bacterium]
MRRIWAFPLMMVLAIGVPQLVSAGWEEGVAAYKAGNLAEAARQFQSVTEEHPEWPDGYFMLGQVLGKLKKNQEGLAASRKAYDLKPGDVRYQMQLGTAYLQSNRFRDAAQLLSKIDESKLSAQQKKIYHQSLAVALDKTGQSGAALGALKKAAQSSPNDADAQFNYGATAFNAGKITEAIGALEKAVQLDGKDPAKRKALVDALMRQGRQTRGSSKASIYAKAATQAQALVALKGTFDNFLKLGEAQLGGARYADAIQSFNQAAAKNSGEWIPHFYIGQASTAKADYPRAEAALKKALGMQLSSENQNRVHKQLGFVYEKQKKYEAAVASYERAGDSAGATRVRENADIAKFNKEADKEAAEYDDLKRKERELQEELKKLGSPPRF